MYPSDKLNAITLYGPLAGTIRRNTSLTSSQMGFLQVPHYSLGLGEGGEQLHAGVVYRRVLCGSLNRNRQRDN